MRQSSSRRSYYLASQIALIQIPVSGNWLLPVYSGQDGYLLFRQLHNVSTVTWAKAKSQLEKITRKVATQRGLCRDSRLLSKHHYWYTPNISRCFHTSEVSWLQGLCSCASDLMWVDSNANSIVFNRSSPQWLCKELPSWDWLLNSVIPRWVCVNRTYFPSKYGLTSR